MSTGRRLATRILALGIVIGSAACDALSSTTTAPGSPTSPTTPTSTTETFSGALPPSGTSVTTFTVVQAGSVNVTLSGLSPTATVGLGLGTSSGTVCTVTSTTTAASGATAQITATENPGSYCVKIFDSGTLTTASPFTLSISHP